MNKLISIAPSPPPLPCDNHLCGFCHKIVNETDKPILCNKCNKCIHIKCNKLPVKQIQYYQTNPDAIFECKNCSKSCVRDKIVAKNHHAIECNICLRWIHIYIYI